MDKYEMEGYVDEMYAMHKQIVDMHNNAAYRIMDLTDQSKITTDNVDRAKADMARTVSEMKKYCRRLTCVVMSLMVLLSAMFFWNFYLVMEQKDEYIRIFHAQWKYAEDILVRQENLLVKYKELKDKKDIGGKEKNEKLCKKRAR